MQELRVHFCDTSPASAGVRSFLSKNYPQIVKLNPRLPMDARYAEGVKASAYVRYDWGVEETVELDGLSEDAVEAKFRYLVSRGENQERSPESLPKDRDIIDEIDVRIGALE